MKNIQEVTMKICDLKGAQLGIEAAIQALVAVLPPDLSAAFREELQQQAEAGRVALLNEQVSDRVLSAFDDCIHRM